MSPSMTGCRAKLQRAQDLQAELENDVVTFATDHPVKVTVERMEAERMFLFRVWNVSRPKENWSLLLGDSLHNGRAALDHLAYQLALLHLGRELTNQEARRIHFPVTETTRSFSNTRIKLRSLLRPDDLARIEMIQPYNQWDETVWGPLLPPGPPAPIPSYLNLLTDLDNVDKHRMLHPVWASPALGKQPRGARELGITGASTSDQPLVEGAEIGRWFFDSTPPEVHNITDPSLFYPIHISLRSPHFGTRVGRILRNCITAAQFVLDMFEPCVTAGDSPTQLQYWNTDKIEL